MSPHALSEVAPRLDRVRGSIRRLFLLDGASRLAMGACVFVVATFALDYAIALPREVRLAFLLIGLASLGWIAARRVARPLGVRISDDDLALFVERHYPELQDRLISALQLARSSGRTGDENSPELVNALVADASAAARALDFNSVVVRTHVLKTSVWAGIIAAVVAVSAGATDTTRTLAGIYARRALGLNVPWPRRTRIEVYGFVAHERTIARGDDLVLAVGFRGEHPGKVRIEYRFASGEGGKEIMTETAEGKFTCTFTQVPGPFEFVVIGNDDTTDTHRVHTKNPPGVEEVRLFMVFPDYLKRENTPEDQPVLNGNIQAPLGTRVSLLAICNEDLAEATLRLGVKGREIDTPLAVTRDARIVTGTIDVEEAYSEYQLLLKAANGLPNRDPIRYTIKGLIDMPPQIAVFDPLGEENLTKDCERPIVADVKDDNGIAEIIIEWKKEGTVSTDWTGVKLGPEHLTPTAYGPGVKQMKVGYVLNIAPTQAVAGEYVHLRIRAADYKDVKGERNIGTSKAYRFSVVPAIQLETEVQNQIEKVKRNIEDLRRRQFALYENTARLGRQFAAFDKLDPDQTGEVRQAGNEQDDVTNQLTTARNDIDRIKRRGLWNKIFSEGQSGDLASAVEVLDVAVAPRGPAPVAGMLCRNASQEGKEVRSRLLNDARGFQSQVLTAIDNALKFLNSWTTYNEIIRLTRSAQHDQEKLNERLRKK